MADDLGDSRPTRTGQAVAAWLRSGSADLAGARILSDTTDDDVDPFIVAFHAQQAVEKAVNPLLIWLGRPFPPTHDLTQLVELLPRELSALAGQELTDLTVYAVPQRYPASSHDPMDLGSMPDWPEARNALDLATGFLDMVQERVRHASGLT